MRVTILRGFANTLVLKTSLEEMRVEAKRRLKEEGPTELLIVAGRLVRKRTTRH